MGVLKAKMLDGSWVPIGGTGAPGTPGTGAYTVYPNKAARDADQPTPTTGMMCHTVDTKTTYMGIAGVWLIYTCPWTAFTPTWSSSGTQPNAGSGAYFGGRYKIVDGVCFYTLEIDFGQGGGFAAGTGTYYIGAPPVPFGSYVSGYSPIGNGHLTLGVNNAQRYNPVALRSPSAQKFEIYTPVPWAATTPAAPVNTNAIQLYGQYETGANQ